MIKRLNYFLLFCLLTIVSSCAKDDTQGTPTPNLKAIGTYSYDNVSRDLLLGLVSEDEAYCNFLFSPQDNTQGKVNTYFSISLKTHFLGQEINPDDVFHNDDYIFVYEDPDYFYSQYKKVKGTIKIARNGKSNFSVKLDLILADGKTFKTDFTGVLTVAE